MYFGACVLVLGENGTILAVSRKDDKQDFGLPGGKVEPGETPLEAAGRELLEETGFKIADARYSHIIYHAEADGKLAVTYEVPFAALKKIKEPTESGVVAWVTPDVLAAGKTFGDYNRGLFKTCGIKLKSDMMTNYASYSSSLKKK